MADPSSLPQQLTELRDLVVAYAKQETVQPLRKLAKWFALHVAGAVLLGFGVVFLAVAGLRALQEETDDTFTGGWSWAPYAIVIVALALGAVATWKARGARRRRAATR